MMLVANPLTTGVGRPFEEGQQVVTTTCIRGIVPRGAKGVVLRGHGAGGALVAFVTDEVDEDGVPVRISTYLTRLEIARCR